jgi:hypothetical protein
MMHRAYLPRECYVVCGKLENKTFHFAREKSNERIRKKVKIEREGNEMKINGYKK